MVWFKFNKLGLALGVNLNFYVSVTKRSKLKVKKFLALIRTFVEVTGGKVVRGEGGGLFGPLPILNRVNIKLINNGYSALTEKNCNES